MFLKITTPEGITKTIETYSPTDVAYFAKWREQGYIVEEVESNMRKVHISDSVCTACDS